MRRPPGVLLRLSLLLLLWACDEPGLQPYDPAEAGRRMPEVLAALASGEPQAALSALARLREDGAVEGSDHYEAVAHLDAGEPALALVALDRELAAHPGNGTARLLLAEALLDMGRVNEAPAQLELAARLLDHTPYLALVSARVALALDDDQKARTQWLAYLSQDPISARAAEAHHGLSRIAARQGDRESAEREQETSAYLVKVTQFLNAYHQRLQEDPGDHEAALGVGMTYLDLFQHFGDQTQLLDQARGAFEAVLQGDAGNTRALFNLGYIATVTGHPETAHRWFAETLAEDPEHLGALLNDGTLWLREGQLDQAGQRLRQALVLARESGDRVRARLELGRLGEAAGDLDQAALQYRAALVENPSDPRLAGLEEHLAKLLSPAEG